LLKHSRSVDGSSLHHFPKSPANFKIDVLTTEAPPRAVAEFNVMVIVSDQTGMRLARHPVPS